MSLLSQLESLINFSQDLHETRTILFNSGGCAQRWIIQSFTDPTLVHTEAPHMAAVAVGMLVFNGDSEVNSCASPRSLFFSPASALDAPLLGSLSLAPNRPYHSHCYCTYCAALSLAVSHCAALIALHPSSLRAPLHRPTSNYLPHQVTLNHLI